MIEPSGLGRREFLAGATGLLATSVHGEFAAAQKIPADLCVDRIAFPTEGNHIVADGLKLQRAEVAGTVPSGGSYDDAKARHD
jgi:hypothetical protein